MSPKISIPHSYPTIEADDLRAVRSSLAGGQLAQNGSVEQFERSFCRSQGVSGAVAVNSGTAALHLSLLALNVKKGDEVIIPSFVCSALLNAVLYTGAAPRIADVDDEDGNISPASARKLLSRRTKAVIVPHMFGRPADMTAIRKLGVPVIEDCAQALGATLGKKKAGSLGTLAVCSFYATKMITTGEGGMIYSNDRRLFKAARELREYDRLGSFKIRYNYKMTEFQAALGIRQLAKLPGFIAKRRRVAKEYDRALSGSSVSLPVKEKGRGQVYYRYVARARSGLNRKIEQFHKAGIRVERPVLHPLHRLFGRDCCPVADELMKTCLSLPVYPRLTTTQLRYVLKEARRILK